MKVLIATGGTGGHIFVALALARELNKYGINTVFTASGNQDDFKEWPCYYIHMKGLLGKNIMKKLMFPFSFSLSMVESFLVIVKERPQAVLGTGSYPSVTPALASKFFLIPLFITEIDSVPGMATRLLSFFASRIYLCYKDATRWLPKSKIRVFGCPVRALRFINNNTAKEELGFNSSLPLVFVFGGSSGARRINNLMVNLVPQLGGIQFLLSTGIRDYNEISEKLEGYNNVKIYPFIDDMGLGYSAADLLISRAGALTLAEIIKFKKPAILIPFPYATLQHQYRNARSLEEMGCVRVITEKVLSAEKLKEEIEDLIEDADLRKTMTNCFPDANNGAKNISKDIAKCLGI
ncbi:undecaprenyldiphospho-muramoylpentapeptide beta-N-acetylglucosaminyltransferase [candidate division WOR-3 bacterium]|nr:undecaprenyldiphospho-muramoylpentapeptide beta-N-acetylglucosaminyltransferase [candidate division WOR-3 bacterium]